MQIAAVAAVIVFVFRDLAKPMQKREVPFISVSRKIVGCVVQAMNIKDNDMVYELGCGDCRVLAAAYNQNPMAKYIGIEKNTIPFLLSKWRLRKILKPDSVDLLKKDMFDCNLSEATIVYAYLYPHIMDKLLPKLKQELKPGAKLVSCDFIFKEKEFNEIIDLKRPGKSLGKKLYVYRF
ncbi:MAG: putative methyltransferase [Parcubacteria group bacterium Licking1014_17]|nr:MAG: putative methyltransferase [Parcubacteria group bacterium Licking1014_17]